MIFQVQQAPPAAADVIITVDHLYYVPPALSTEHTKATCRLLKVSNTVPGLQEYMTQSD